MRVNSFDGSTYYFLPGGSWCWSPRSQRRERRFRASSKTSATVVIEGVIWYEFASRWRSYHLCICVSVLVCHALGRRGSCWLWWRERVDGNHVFFPSFCTLLKKLSGSLSELWNLPGGRHTRRSISSNHFYYRGAALQKHRMCFLHCKLILILILLITPFPPLQFCNA